MLRSVNKTTHMLLTHSNLVWVLVFVFTATEISEIDDKNYPYENIWIFGALKALWSWEKLDHKNEMLEVQKLNISTLLIM